MVIKNWFILIVLLTVFISCKNKAANFNNELVTIQKKVLKEVGIFGEKLQQTHADTVELAILRMDGKKVIHLIESEIKRVQNLDTPRKAENFKQAVLNQLEFQKDLVNKIRLMTNVSITENERQCIEMDLAKSLEVANQKERNVRDAQEAFAKENNIKLETF